MGGAGHFLQIPAANPYYYILNNPKKNTLFMGIPIKNRDFVNIPVQQSPWSGVVRASIQVARTTGFYAAKATLYGVILFGMMLEATANN